MPEGWKVLKATWIPGPYNWRQYLSSVVAENEITDEERRTLYVSVGDGGEIYYKGSSIAEVSNYKMDSLVLLYGEAKALHAILGMLIESHATLDMDKRDFAEEHAKKENPE
jgi:hypothetical protein